MKDFEDLDVEPIHPSTEHAIRMTWRHGSTRFEAELVRSGDIPTVRRFAVEAESAVPASDRRLPPDVVLVSQLRQMGVRGAGYLAYLLGQSLYLEDISDPSATEKALRAALLDFGRDVGRRPHSRRPELIRVAERLLAEGRATNEVVTVLVAEGVSTATAFRLIKRARAGQGRGE